MLDKEKDDSCASLEQEIRLVNRELEDHFTTKEQLENKKTELAVKKDKYISEVTELKEKVDLQHLNVIHNIDRNYLNSEDWTKRDATMKLY